MILVSYLDSVFNDGIPSSCIYICWHELLTINIKRII
jgi:hypothetical protein